MSTGKSAEELIRDSDERARALADASFDAIIFSDRGIFIDQNLTAEKMFGYSREELLGRPVTDLVTPEDRQRVEANILAGNEAPYELTALRKDGSNFPCEVRGRMFDYRGRRVRVASLRDVSNYRQVKQLLRDTGRMAKVGGWEHDLATGKATWTESLHEVLAIPPEATPGVGEHLDYYPAKDRAILKEAYDRAVREGIPFDLELQGYNGRGELRWWRVYGEPVYENGKCVTMRGSLHDVTERREAEDALKLSEARFRGFLENLGDVAYVADLKGNLVYTNKAGEAATGKSWDDLIDKPFLPLFEPESQVKAAANYARSLKGETIEDQLTFLNGKVYHFKSEPRFSPEGEIIGVFGIARDITGSLHAQQALRESERKYRDLIAHIPDVVWSSDENGHTCFISDNVADIYGYTSKEIYSADEKLWFGRIHPDDLDNVKKAYKRLLEENKAYDIEYRIKTKWGDWIWLHDRALRSQDDGGKVRIDGVFSDITERKLVQEALRKSETHLNTLIRTIPDLVWLKDPDGVFLSCNQRFEKFFGSAVAEIIGKTDYDFVDKELADFFRENDRAAMVSGKPTTNEEEVVFASDGHTEILETIKTPMYDDDGNLVGVLGIGRDITDRKRAEEALRESEIRYRAISEDMPVLICRFKPGGELTYVNEAYCKYFSRSVDELVGTCFLDLIPENQRQGVLQGISSLTIESPTQSQEYQVVMPNGEYRWQRWTNRALFNAKLECVAYQSIGEDVTERKLAEEALRESERKLVQAQSVAHVGSWDLDLLTNKLEWSDEIYRIFGLKPDEFGASYDAFLQSVHPEDRDLVDETYRKSVEYRQPYDVTHRLLLPDGSIKWAHERGLTYYDEDGKPVRSVGTVMDVTKLKRAQRELQSRERKYRTLFENMMNAFALHEVVLDEEGNPIDYVFLEANSAFEKMTGLSQQDLIGKRVTETIPGIENDQANWIGKYGQVALTGKPIKFEQYAEQLERWYAVVAFSPEKGKFATVFDDITERKRAEEALKESERRLATLMGNLPGMAYRCKINSDWTIEFVSSGCRQLTGYQPEDLVDNARLSFAELIHPDDHEMVDETVQAGIREDRPFEIVYRIITADKQEKWVWEQGEGVKDDSGKLVALEGFIADITQRKQAEMALSESEQRFRNVAESMSDYIWETDASGTYIYASENVKEVLGFTAEEIIGKTPFDFMSPSEAERVGLLFSRIAGNHEPMRDLENWNVRKDGKQVCLLTSGVPLFDQTGNLVGYRGVDRDVTERKYAEETLSDLKEFYQTILENVEDGIWVTDDKDALVYLNPGMERIAGVKLEDLVGLSVLNDFPEETIRHFSEFYRAAKESLQPQTYEAEVVTPAGRKTVQSGWLIPRLQDGYYAGMICTVQDVTSRKSAEQALIESEEKFRELANSLPQIVFETDMKGRLTYVNDLAFEKMGYAPEQLEQGLNAVDMIALEDRERAANSLQLVLQGQETKGSEYLAVRRDGSKFPIVVHSRPKIHDGQTLGLRGIVIDISERKLAEEAVRASEAKLSNAMKMAKIGYWEFDVAEGMFTFTDEFYALFRTTAEEQGGYKMSPERYTELFVHPEEKSVVAAEMQVAMEAPQDNYFRQVEHRIVYADGEVGHIAVRFFVVKDSNGNTIKTYGANQDITERVKLEKEIAKSDKLESVGLLAGGIAHDFNNILTAIMGNVSLAKLGVEDDTETYNCLTEAENASARAVQLTAQLLTFAKGGAPILEATSISEIIRETASFSLRGSNVKCEFTLPGDLAMVNADTGQLSQVINNLIINADQAMPEGGTVKIGAANVELPADNGYGLKAGRYVQVNIADQGVGISAKHLGKVFDPFFTTKQKGNGLGLASVYSIIKKHSGHITVDSELNVGTTFTILLPALVQNRLKKKSVEKDEIVHGSGRVLVVDDEQSVRRLAGAILSRLGYEVEVATEGSEAIEMYRAAMAASAPYTVVVLDLTIPGGLGGLETLERLLKLDPHVKAVVSSGYSTDPVMANYQAHGFLGRLSKPFVVSEFSQVMKEVAAPTPIEI